MNWYGQNEYKKDHYLKDTIFIRFLENFDRQAKLKLETDDAVF